MINCVSYAIGAQTMRSGCARHSLNRDHREEQKVLTQKSQSLNDMHPGASLFIGLFREFVLV